MADHFHGEQLSIGHDLLIETNVRHCSDNKVPVKRKEKNGFNFCIWLRVCVLLHGHDS